MICNKCGAPVPMGMKECPYCGERAEPIRGTAIPDDETSFVGSYEGMFTAESEEKTVFAPRSDVYETGETEFVPQFSSVQPIQRMPDTEIMKGKMQKPSHKKITERCTVDKKRLLRVVLLAILVGLILLLLLR